MKCTLVVNQLNDPFYIDYDEEFARHIITTSKEKGLIEENADVTELDANLVMQLFSPLVLSQWLLIGQTKEPCSSVTCPNGFIFVFKHVDGLLFLTINGDSTESEDFLHRKTHIFIRLMKFLFGPVSEEIGESQYSSKKSKWEFLRILMKTWSEMVATEQAFLVEAIERLSVNENVSGKCIEILEKAVKQIQAVHNQPTQHAVLLVNSKLLALYSNRNAHELTPKDILSLIVLAKTMYPRSDHLEDMFSKPYVNKKSNNSNAFEDNSDGVDDEYHSAPATPSCDTRSRASSTKSEHGERKAFPEHDTKRESVSMSDTDTIINSFVQVSLKTEPSTNDKNNQVHKSLIDMYREKCLDAEVQEEDVETDGTETTQEMICVDHIVIADVHNEQGSFTDDNTNNQNVGHDGKGSSLPSVENGNVKKERKPYSDDHIEEVIAQDTKEVNKMSPEKEDSESNENKCLNLNSEKGAGVLNNDYLTDIKGRSRASTASSEKDGSTAEEISLRSSRSTTSSVMSNASHTYPELSLHIDSSLAGLSLASMGLQQPENGKKDSENSQDSQGYGPEKSKQASSSTVEESAFLIDTMQSVKFHRKYGSYLPQTVFLETATCLFSPHNIFTAQVLPGVTILFLSQAPRHALADPLYQVMSNIQDLIYGRRVKLPRSRSLHVYEIINSLLGKLHNSLRKFKGREKYLISDIHARWEKEEVKHRLLEYLEKDSRYMIPPDVESPLMEMYKKLRELFSLLFLYPPPENPQLIESLSQLRVSINSELLDYREYLNVKSQRNITMTSYFEKFPGLIYFICVDRRLHQMTAPSINISLNEGEDANACSYLKENIWRMYQHMMKKVNEGYTTVILREGDFYYSYFLWFEDSVGNPLDVQDSFKPSQKFPYPGILCGNFYKEILQQCFPHALANSVFCFEMFLMHVGSIHPQYIATHCKKLAAELWEMSDVYSSLNLF